MNVRAIAPAFLSIALGAALAGCDETVSEKKTVESKDDGTRVEKRDTVTREADGDVVREKKTDVDRPGTDDNAARDDDAKLRVKVDNE
jgi:hypothetical protein